MNCPRCQTALQARPYETVEVDGCPACGGMWLERGELEKIQETVGNDYSGELARPDDAAARAYEMARQRARPAIGCPKCGRPMAKTECQSASVVLVDLCGGCGGLWLDRGEVQALEVFYERLRQEERAEARRGFFSGLRRLFRDETAGG